MGLHMGICAFFHCKCAILDDVLRKLFTRALFISKYLSCYLIFRIVFDILI